MIKRYLPERVFSSTTERTSVSLKSSGAAVVLALNTNAFGTWTCMAYRSGSCPGEESRPEVIVRQPVFAFGEYEEESNLARVVALVYPRVERVRRGAWAHREVPAARGAEKSQAPGTDASEDATPYRRPVASNAAATAAPSARL
jgi:hypothetical protein